MPSLRKCLSYRFRMPKKTEKPTTESKHKETQENPMTKIVQSVPYNSAALPIQLMQTSQSRDLWQAAYNQLDKTQRHILSINKKPTEPGNRNNHLQKSIDEVIQITAKEYEKHCQAADGNFYKSLQKILNAALSFKDIIGAVAALDPTQHAASIWSIVSLGLTMAKSYTESREALFQSSEYLAEILTYGAFVEQNFYKKRKTMADSHPVEDALIRLYKTIFCYAVQIQKIHNASIGRKVLNTVTDNSQQSLSTLQAVAENERAKLNQSISMDHYLSHEKEANEILHKIDGLADSAKQLLEQSLLHKILFAEGASFDSFTEQHENFCLPNTRTDLLNQISKWAQSEGSPVFWLNGMAGTGKSTIARTVARLFLEQGLLGATFFFKRGEADRGTSKRFISTLTRQLITGFPGLKNDVLHAVEKNSQIMTKSLNIQFEELFYKPLTKLCSDQRTTSVIVIDALDECEGDNDSRQILNILFKMQEVKSVHLRVFLTSRPELPIRLGFKNHKNHRDIILHQLPKPVIEHDIRVFLEYELSKIQQERSLSSNWLENDTIEKLVQTAVPLFIVAATICRFVGGGLHPKKQLQKFLELQANTTATQMDKTYLPVLNQLVRDTDNSAKEIIDDFQNIVGVIILLASPLSINSLAQLLQISAGDISELLDYLHSVLYVPSNTNTPVRILHLSFRDYLLITKSPFHVNEQETHMKIVSYCLRLMKAHLKQNICELQSYGAQHEDITPEILNRHLTADLQYACRYWVHHLEQSKERTLDYDFLSFLQDHFLHWLEVLALTGGISEAVGFIDTLKSKAQRGSDLSDFLYDAERFIRQNSYMAGVAPLQLYCAGLLFAPNKSVIKQIFYHKVKTQVAIKTTVEDFWSSNLQSFEGHSSSVCSVAFSLDGRTLASGSKDNTIKLWDTATGVERHTLTGHSSWVKSVAFSPDGRTLASGSRDNTIKIWDTATGVEQHTLTSHSGWVYSVAFSPDGRILASGSEDNTIKIWDIATGVEQRTLTGYFGLVRSVAFSPDGRTLASGSGKTIKLWDTATGVEQRTLTGHSSYIWSLAFSPDGRTLASGSGDNTIKIWDTATGVEQHTLTGHSSFVESVAFSPDGRTLASGSGDKTIKLWDTAIGVKQRTLIGYTSWIYSVAFSPDGRTVASGSEDTTIALWDAATGVEQRRLASHSRLVYSVAFSLDGRTLASGSADNTIKLWDTAAGVERHTLTGHSDWVYSVAFSPDSRTLASGSEDLTIKLWDTATGVEKRTLTGHSQPVHSVVFSPDGQTLASGSGDDTIKLWDTATGVERRTLTGHSSWIYSVAFSPDGRTLASGSSDQTIKLWDTTTGVEQRTLTGQSQEVHSVAFSPDGQTLVSGSHDKTIKLWDMATGVEQRTLTGHFNSAQFVVEQSTTSYSLSVADSWVSLRGNRVLWLPVEYRSFWCFAVKDTTLTLGLGDGRVQIISFDIQ